MAALPAPTVAATHLAGIPSVLSPEEFTDRFVPSEYGPTWASAADIAVRPAHWARGDGQTWEEFVDSVARDGIRQPVQVHDGVWCTDGHHRVVAAMATGTPIPWEPADNPDYDGQIPEGVEDYHRFAVEDGDTDLIDDAAPWDDDWWADVAERRDRNLGVLAYDCRDGTVHITPGVLDEQARAAFLLGGCGALAAAMHRAHGWPVVGLWATDDEPFHVGVLAPDGLVVDIDGAHTPQEWAMAYGAPDDCEYEPLTVEETARVVNDVRRPDEQPFGIPGAEGVAASFVEPVTGLWRAGIRGWVADSHT
ncbi:hypothetical protein DVS28_b0291 (plasmid) [Euzebya pacifica]|uniref:ParB-like nuclease domain-containing protein n=1 Tax=Euzebya pacifica TaxID=1608957 RepID=A0A346Y6G4_9ACTN|nr:ParB/Srx family N-terminal domain-containing protein [Euzebya pacifica]AXV10061.1 hypothetical protein DVS28_b0291 [Euzebya pacifica]